MANAAYAIAAALSASLASSVYSAPSHMVETSELICGLCIGIRFFAHVADM